MEIIKNQLIRIPYVRGKARQRHSTGVGHDEGGIREVFDFYSSHVDLVGKHVLELGPGKTAGVALRLTETCDSVSLADTVEYLDRRTLEDAGIDYRIYDGEKAPFQSETFDVVLSHTVYEHIKNPLTTIRETFRLLRPPGVTCHLIDLGNHFSYGIDGGGERLFEHLKYSETTWNLMTSNRSNYVNRCRYSDWVGMHQRAGFTIIKATAHEDEALKELYGGARLAYLRKEKDMDRFVSHVILVAEKN